MQTENNSPTWSKSSKAKQHQEAQPSLGERGGLERRRRRRKKKGIAQSRNS